MNLFVLDYDPAVAARMLCDKHVVKMLLETAQLLSTAHHLLDGTPVVAPVYKPTHKNHPCARWVQEASANYSWAYDHLLALAAEYTRRYQKTHATEQKGVIAALQQFPLALPVSTRTDFVQCMPDEYKRGNPVDAYRAYYVGDKAYMATWKSPASVPGWFNA